MGSYNTLCNPSLWKLPTAAKKWSEGITVLYITDSGRMELTTYFRPDWVNNRFGYGNISWLMKITK